MPMRILTVTGTRRRRPRRPRVTMSSNSSMRHGSAAPPPLRVTLGTGQPKFRSTWSARSSLDDHPHRRADHGRVDAVELQLRGVSSASKRISRSVFGLRSTSARVVIISLTNSTGARRPCIAAQPAERACW